METRRLEHMGRVKGLALTMAGSSAQREQFFAAITEALVNPTLSLVTYIYYFWRRILLSGARFLKEGNQVLKAYDITRIFSGVSGKKVALDQVYATFERGITTLIGANGSGKTTLLKILATIDSPTSGTLQHNGETIGFKSSEDYRDCIGYVPQDVRFVSGMKCDEALAYAAWVSGMSRSQAQPRIPEVLQLVGLSLKAKEKVGSLSGGQNRRLGIAAALIHRPDILFLDEPTAGLDPQSRLEIREILQALAQQATIVISTHLIDDVEGLSQKTLALHEGRAVFHGTWHELSAAAATDNSLNSSDKLENALAFVSQRASISSQEEDAL
ncbi:ATP-binding cassette domain-containing protein [Corynebacterium casei]|uniref:ATP-binding cassette domain-containing protein n=1 Tax=Corynebacterium casei TaxID=160386 RepID=UPI000ECF14F0|nr:ATP-binding cassette domain-containing protein [Corynebacterium casei]MDN5902691.1 ATP-binding cassette domain-containing protein [Corynebacterium casei]HCJ69471.1 hypothetical protein [Corynebacterium casei]